MPRRAGRPRLAVAEGEWRSDNQTEQVNRVRSGKYRQRFENEGEADTPDQRPGYENNGGRAHTNQVSEIPKARSVAR